MLIAEYSYETDIKVQRREAYREGLAEGIEQGIEQGAEQKAIETAKNMILQSVGTLDQISSITGLSVEDISKLKEELETK
ncbi:MAG: hypothetical protein J6C25_00320 [Treponema sp.]|nr:hypothetical protein [Treponema sp.]